MASSVQQAHWHQLHRWPSLGRKRNRTEAHTSSSRQKCGFEQSGDSCNLWHQRPFGYRSRRWVSRRPLVQLWGEREMQRRQPVFPNDSRDPKCCGVGCQCEVNETYRDETASGVLEACNQKLNITLRHSSARALAVVTVVRHFGVFDVVYVGVERSV